MADIIEFGRRRADPRLVRSGGRSRPGHRGRRFRSGRWPLLAALAALAMAGLFLSEERANSTTGHAEFRLCRSAVQQDCVIDGDTLRYGGLTIRIADIDAPETRQSRCASEAALGRQATHALLDIMNDGPFQLVSVGSRDEDRYGRKLRVIKRDGASVGDTLVERGLARPWEGRRRSWCN
ncbi:thermonuclease family protein [Faunimonas sp. B44]|uniref:thermonuclease family protein n=1 Tax=Faunimonas sp. B44 TaxID=3461493 RepID=UPI004043DDD2